MNRQVIKNRIRKILAYTVTGVLFLLISAFLILQIPAVQGKLVDRFLSKFSEVIGFHSTVQNVRMLWFDRLELENVMVYDPDNNEMIAADRILINFKLSNLLVDSDVNVDGVVVENARVLVTNINENDTTRNLNINVFINRINQNYSGSGGSGKAPKVNIGEAVITGSKFTYIDQDHDSVKYGFNYRQFAVDIDEGQLQNFMILGDTTEFQVTTLLATEPVSKLQIKELSTFFRLSQKSMEFSGMRLKINESIVSDTVLLTYDGRSELSNFIEKVNVHANFVNTVLQPEDLAVFAPEAGRMTQPIKLQGIFNGRINNFKFSEMEITTGNSVLRGSVDMDGLPNLTETFIILNARNSQLDFRDLDFAIDPEFISRLTPIGRVSLDGEFLGYTSDFVAKGNFISPLGEIVSDINFKVDEKNINNSVYSGELVLKNFDVGGYLKDTANFQRVTLDGKIKGSGLTVSTADFTLNGKVRSIGIRNYDYRNIETNARFASQRFNGFFKIDDPNLQFTARGFVDLRKGVDLIRITAQLDTAYLDRLKLTRDPIFIRSGIDVNTKGLHIDSLIGAVDLKDFFIQYKNQELTLANVKFTSEKNDNLQSLTVNSTILDAKATGNYVFTDLSKDLEKLVKEILLNVKNDESEIVYYYQNENYRPNSYETNFDILLKDVKPLIQLLNVDMELSPDTKIEAKFSSGYTSIFQLYSKISSFTLNGKQFSDNEVEVTASKIADSTSVLAVAYINSKKQTLSQTLKTEDLLAEAIWNKNHIEFALDADQQEKTNYVRLKGALDFLKDSTEIRMLPSTIHVLDKEWSVDSTNLTTIMGKRISIEDLQFNHQSESILFDGAISENPEEKLSLRIRDLDLSILSPVTGKEIEGNLNALFDLTDYYVNPYVENDLAIDSLTIDKFLVGNIQGKNQWDNAQKKFLIDFFIDRQGERIVKLDGYYNPTQESSPLDVTAKLQEANLKIIEPFFDEMFSQLGGTITGEYQIGGKIQAPSIVGEGQVDGGKIMINYLKTIYSFEGTVGLSPNSIYFKNLQLFDYLQNKAMLNGTITHRDFKDTRINIDVGFSNFQVLNTTARDNSLFYGQGYASGDLNIFGPVSNLKFSANARTDKNTRISIPFGGVEEVEKKDFIKFVSFTDSTFINSLTDKVSSKLDLTGITLDFNLDITPDAYCEIILDLKAGDIIKGRGTGELQLQLDTKGEFNMFGPFEFTEGYYNFTLYDLFNKDFDIKKGSRITWFGDPYTAQVDISATYDQQASFAPIILDPAISTSPQLRRKYPVQVLIELDGLMFSPQPTFDIVTRDLPQSIIVNNQPVRLNFEFQAFKNRIDEQELKRQVFSLIVLRRFSPPESFNTTGGDVVNSVSELFSNQLSNFVSQMDENLEIDLDFSRMDEEQFNTFQLRFAYTLLNGRLRVSRDGTFYSNQGNSTVSNANQNISSIVGDWTVDYLLTPDGNWKIKMYNRTNINPILNTLGTNNSVTTGVSLTNTRSFNELKDIWRSARKRRKEEQESEPIPDTNKEAIKEDKDGGE
jgi:hypothetical protein